jgi:hypothetical protein
VSPVRRALAAVPLVLLAPAPARAGVPVLAFGHLAIRHDATAFQVCADGRVDDGGTVAGKWVLWIYGGRIAHDPAGLAARPLSATDTYSTAEDGAAFPLQCEWVAPNGVPEGTFSAQLTFAGAGTDVTGVWGGVGTWSAATGLTEQHYATNRAA